MNVPMPATEGSNVPLAPLVIPVPLHVPPPVAAERLKEEAATQVDGAVVIVASSRELTFTVTVSVAPHDPLNV